MWHVISAQFLTWSYSFKIYHIFELYTWKKFVSLLDVCIQKLSVCVQFWTVFYAVETSGCVLWGRGLWVMREPITEPHWSITETFSLLFSMTGSCISVKSFKNTHEGFEVWTCCMNAGGLSSWCFTAAFPSSFILHCMSFFFLHVCFCINISFILHVYKMETVINPPYSSSSFGNTMLKKSKSISIYTGFIFF